MQYDAGRWAKFGALLGLVSAVLVFLLALVLGASSGRIAEFSFAGLFVGALIVVGTGVLWAIYGFAYSIFLHKVLARMSQYWKIAGLAFLASEVIALFAGTFGIISVVSDFLSAMITAWIAVKLFKKQIPL